jgi:alkanesulfonate monooxygenase SsuD/methylene tetrahydromethanopterin reductase-like flavin-dependent oxidoreductase (luciferase family)
MQIGFFGGAEHTIIPPSWPNRPSAITPADSRKAWVDGIDDYLHAEQLGFDFVSISEHHYSAWMDPSPAMMAAALAQHLTSARICLLGTTLPLHNPVRVAEELALLDVVTNGKVTVGLLRGTPNEVMTYFNINPTESRSMFQEAVELIRACWTEPEAFGWEGRHYRFRTISVLPTPVTPGGPPVLISGSNPASIRFAAEQHAQLGLSYMDLADASERAQLFREAAETFGWSPQPSDILFRGIAYVAETDERAREIALEHRFGLIGKLFQPGSRLTGEAIMESVTGAVQTAPSQARGFADPEILPALCGSPETVLAQLAAFSDAGIGSVDLSLTGLGLPAELGSANLELFAAEVLPAAQKLGVGVTADLSSASV